MIIGFDGKRAVQNNTGLGNYSRLVVDSLSRYYPANSYRLYAPVRRANPRLTPVLANHNVELLTPATAFGRFARHVWRSYGMTSQARADGCEIFHGLSGELPFNIRSGGMASVVTIHDLIFRRYPEYYKAIDCQIYDYKFRRACADATRVIAISECTKRDIMEYYGTPAEKIDVIYQGCHEQFGAAIPPEKLKHVHRQYQLPERYIVTVGTVESRKNQLLAVKALALLPRDVVLYIVGGATPYADEIARYADAHGLSARVRRLEGIPFDHLPALYEMAVVSSYTSRFEGFGLPVIESINSGTPVIACTGSVLEEAGGPGAVYIDPDDVDGFAEAAMNIMENPSLRAETVRLGQEYTARFSHRAMADSIMDTYRRALDRQQ
ncbi:glycosyltransferase family 4 protein [Muribaculum intestinale]|jgi:glycosyltransferase involved in cell wall biosynthesis|uniref:glycosyltransferase family 4 protein n=1 Tax=Muribaculum intestinale TaxID=1796646 RepID=UPI00242B1D4D|nr:glycosyltransferase family 1 protein [Muribaculum intestinale]